MSNKGFQSWKETSRVNLGNEPPSLTIEAVKAGSLQRIADACELIAKDRQQMERELASLRKSYKALQYRKDCLEKSNASLKGQVTKLKNQLAELKSSAEQ